MACMSEGHYQKFILISLFILLFSTIAVFVAFASYVSVRSENKCSSDCLDVNLKEELRNNEHSHGNCSNGFDLGNELFVHVCLYEGEVIIDLRKFIDSRPLRIGIGLQKENWYALVDKQLSISKLVKDVDYNYSLFGYKTWDIPSNV